MAERAIDLGFYISISGPVTYRNAGRLVDVVRALPLDRLLVETDCPFLTPHPHRGERNEPAYVRLVADKIAALKGLSPEQVARATTANARRLFGIEVRHPGAAEDQSWN
jgi:TatD DNase family protein